MSVKQFGQRSANSASGRFSRRRSPSPDAFGAETADAAPVSQARLAAEAAFASLPSDPTPSGQPQITVRRARIARPRPSGASIDGQPATDAAIKGPRVFRVDALPAAMPEPEAASLHGVRAGRDDPAAARPVRPKSRQLADRRPGPVVHVLQPVPARPDDKPSARQLTLLATALAGIDPVFQAIERARALIFIDGSFADRWRALAEQASTVRSREASPSASKARRGR